MASKSWLFEKVEFYVMSPIKYCDIADSIWSLSGTVFRVKTDRTRGACADILVSLPK